LPFPVKCVTLSQLVLPPVGTIELFIARRSLEPLAGAVCESAEGLGRHKPACDAMAKSSGAWMLPTLVQQERGVRAAITAWLSAAHATPIDAH
jgi:hypothetical protein